MIGHSKHPGEEQLLLFLYGDPAAGEVEGHVGSCDACQAILRDLERTLAAVDRHQVPERGPAYGGQVWARVQARLKGDARESARIGGFSGAGGWLTGFTPRRLALAGGLAVLLVAAFLVGRWSSPPPAPRMAAGTGTPAQAPPAKPAAGAQLVRDRVLLVAVGEHLERSQMVLIELMNSADDGPVDISATQEWARDLVPTNRLIRDTADQAGERVVADVLDDLERALVEIANSPSPLSKTEFERVRQRIDSEGLVFKMRVLDSEVRAREQPSGRTAQTKS